MSAFSEFVDFISTSENWWGRTGIAHRLAEHVRISGIAVTVAAVVALPPALWLGHRRRGGVLAVAAVNVGQAVPSFAIVSLALPISLRWGHGFGFWPTLVALIALALPPIFTNTYAGVVGVDPAVVQAARGMGMREGEVLRKVELPNAIPLALTGLRLSAVQVVATATLGAFVGFGCLGSFINEGFRQRDDGVLLTGAVLVALLAIATEIVFGLLQRPLTPWLSRKKDTR
ncbi:MAG: ABC transporter permease [Acidimicrobiia bacterium]|nr:ABC transporter permease [Acidimicrobiia bacterium]